MSSVHWVTWQQGIPFVYLAYVREFPKQNNCCSYRFCCTVFALLNESSLSHSLSLSEAFACPLTPTVKVKREDWERERVPKRGATRSTYRSYVVGVVAVVVVNGGITGIELRLGCDVAQGDKLFGRRSTRR